MKLKNIIVTGMIAIICTSAASSAIWARGHKKNWQPDPITAGKMDAAVPIYDDYQVQPPTGWEGKRAGGPGKIGKTFKAPPLPDGSQPYVQVMLMGLPGADRDPRTVEDFLKLHLPNFQGRFDTATWKAGKNEEGTINGIKFVRMHFSGLYGPKKVPEQGFIYEARDGNWVIEITGFDADPTTTDDLKFAEASALTFVKVPQIFSAPTATPLTPAH